MSLIKRKWIQDQAINNQKIDPTDTYTITGLRVDGTNAVGRVGIGVNDPLDALHMRRTDTSVGIILDLDGYSGKSYQLYTDQSGDFHIRDMDNNFDRLTINSDPSLNRIGIDQSSPQDTLDIRSTLNAAAVRLDTDDGVRGRAYRLVSDSDGAFKIIDVDGGSANRLQIADNGTLTVSGDATFDSNFQINGTVTVINTEVILADQLEINQTDNQAALIVSQDTPSATATVMRIENAGTGYALTVDYGNVGIGTLTPAAPLHVQGDIFTADGSNIGDNTHRIGTLYMASAINHLSNLEFNSNGATQVTFDTTNGRVGIGSTAPTVALDVVGDIISNATITASTDITATTGNITATAGAMSAGTTITAGTGITATTGNIVATAGAVTAGTFMSAGTTITAGTGITATAGNITATVGNVIAGSVLQGATLSITTGPNSIAGTTTNTGTFIIQNTTEALCRLIRTASGAEVTFGVSSGSPSTWASGVTVGDSYIKSSLSQAFHIGSASLTAPTITLAASGDVGVGHFYPSYPLHLGGHDAGTSTIVDKIAIGDATASTGAIGDGWGILFRHNTTSGNIPRSRIASVIGSGNNSSYITLSPSAPGSSVPTETLRVTRTTTDSYLDFKAPTGGNANFTTYQGVTGDFRIKTIFSAVSDPDKIVEMGAINGGQTHITYGSGTRGISILSAGATPGYVGIGTQIPSVKLHVIGDAIVSGNLNVGSFTTPTLNISGTGNVQLAIIRTGPGGGFTKYAVTNGPGEYNWATPAAGSSLIQYESGTSLYVGSDGTTSDPYVVFTSGGNVGIGTLSTGTNEVLRVESNSVASGTYAIRSRISNAAASTDSIAVYAQNEGDGKAVYAEASSDATGVYAINQGTGYAGYFTKSNPGSTLYTENTGTGYVFTSGTALEARLTGSSLGSSSYAVHASVTSNATAIRAEATSYYAIHASNASNTAAGYFTSTQGTSLYSSMNGTNSNDIAIYARLSSASADAGSKAIYALNNGAGRAIDATASSGYAGYFSSGSGETVRMECNSVAGGNYVLRCICNNASASTDSIAIMAQNYGNGRGLHATSGIGEAVYANSDSGRAIDGTSNTGYAGYFSSRSGETVRMECDSVAGGNYVLRCICDNTSASTDSIAIMAQNYGDGEGLRATSGSGDAVYALSSSGNAIHADGAVRLESFTSSDSAVNQNLAVDDQGYVSVNGLQAIGFSIARDLSTPPYDYTITSTDVPELAAVNQNNFYAAQIFLKDRFGTSWWPSEEGGNYQFRFHYVNATGAIQIDSFGTSVRDSTQEIRGVVWYHTGTL